MSKKSEWTYERCRLGELTESERGELEAEPDFQNRMAALDKSDQEILEQYPAADMVRAILNRAAGENRNGEDLRRRAPGRNRPERDKTVRDAAAESAESRRFRPVRVIVPLAAAAALAAAVLIALPRLSTQSSHSEPAEILRPKGIDRPDFPASPELILYKDGPDGAELMKSGDLAGEHDLLQVGYFGGNDCWGTIVSVDGNGIITRHWPSDGEDSVPLGMGGEKLLPYAYELDDAPDFEAFALIWSDRSFPIADAESLLAGFHRGDSLPDVSILNPVGKTGITVITIRKAP